MTLFKALKILLKQGEKETIVLGFKDWHASTAFNTIRYLGEKVDEWMMHSWCPKGGFDLYRKGNAEAYNFIKTHLEQGKQIWVKQSTCDHYNV